MLNKAIQSRQPALRPEVQGAVEKNGFGMINTSVSGKTLTLG